MVLVKFLLLFTITCGLLYFYKHMGMDFVWGGLFVVFLYQFAYKIVHGIWIEF